MLIKYIKLCNFLPFYGEHKMEFDVSSKGFGNNSISVVIAANNSGKTSIIRALRFLFYGASNEDDVKKMPNLEAIRCAPKGKTVESYVEAKILGSKDFVIRRTIRVSRKGAKLDNLTLESIDVERFEDTPLGSRPSNDKDVIERHVRSLMPDSIFDFFFFKGEELADKVLAKENANIRKSLTELLYQNKWKAARDTLLEVRTEYSKQLNKLRKGNEELDKALTKKQQLIELIETCAQSSEELEEEILSSQREYDNLDRELANCDTESSKLLQAKIREGEAELTRIQKKRSDMIQRKRMLIGDKGSYVLLAPLFPKVLELLKQTESGTGIPKNITDKLIDELLRQSECICGCSLKEGSTARGLVKDLKANSFEDKSAEIMLSLRNRLNDDDIADDAYPRKAKDTVLELATIDEDLDDSRRKINRQNETIRELRKRFTEADEDNVSTLRKKRQTAGRKLKEKKSRLEKLRENHIHAKDELEEVTERLAKLGKSIGDARATALLGTTDTLDMMIKNSTHKMQKQFHRALLDGVSEVYDRIATDNSRAHIDEETLLPEIEKDGVRGLPPGGGQQQTLVLAYIMALSKLRRSINESLKEEFDIAVRKLGEQCFFMDSVFAPMQGEYRQAVADVLPGKMPQLVLLLSQNQWDADVQAGLNLDDLDKVYLLIQRTPKEVPEDGYYANFYGVHQTLVEKLADKTTQAHTIIEEVMK